MKIELLGKNVLVPQIVTETSECGRVVESKRSQSAVLGKIDREMAGDAGAATVADENDLVAGAVRFVGGVTHPLAPVRQGDAFRGTVGDLGSMKEIRQRRKISTKLLAH
jgi:hypothetical protein